MNGREVFRFATRVMADACREVIASAGLSIEDISLIIPHQANRRIIEAAARNLQLPMERFVMNVDRYGNTSTASIPLAVCEAVSEGKIRPDDNLVFVAFGAGLTWGATVVKWDVTTQIRQTSWYRLRRQTLYQLASIRSAMRRGARAVEGVVWGSQAPSGVEPPHQREGAVTTKSSQPDKHL
jgi:3-oxoacyl-[acyl-carrier-protein] synthase-3